ncbi:MAG: FkbM family methyltransferase [Phycisphaerales bacterium]|nr:FkbM family methyltransferase [Phycisphaerales bacterium]
MSGHRFFNSMRAGLGPMIRPFLEKVGPVRKLGLWALARRQPREVTLDGQVFSVDPRDFGVTFELHSTGTYEPFTRGACLDLLGPGMTFLDIGSHVGLYALPAARILKDGGRVIAFEPHPGNRALLEENVSRNQVDNVTVVDAAVSDAPGELELQVSPFNTGDHRLYRGNPGRGTGVRTRVVSIDEWCEQHEIDRVDMVKIDVQGAEARVIAGMQKVIDRSDAMNIILEYTPWMLREAGDEPRALLDSLAERGFSLSIIDEGRGELKAATPVEIHEACPGRSYVNVLACRGKPR